VLGLLSDLPASLPNEVAFKFSQSAEDMEDKLAATGCGIDLLLKNRRGFRDPPASACGCRIGHPRHATWE
jgi:hypothetical protein